MYISSNIKVREAVQATNCKSYDELSEEQINKLTGVVMKEFYNISAYEVIFEAEDISNVTQAFQDALLTSEKNPIEHAKAIHRFFKAFAKNSAEYLRDKIEETIEDVVSWRNADNSQEWEGYEEENKPYLSANSNFSHDVA